MLKTPYLALTAAVALLCACTPTVMDVETPAGEKLEVVFELGTEEKPTTIARIGDKTYSITEYEPDGTLTFEEPGEDTILVDGDKKITYKCIEFKHSDPEVPNFDDCVKMGVSESEFELVPQGSVVSIRKVETSL